MIEVKFDDKSENKLVLLWSAPDAEKETADYSRAASLLFSVIGGGAGRWPEAPAQKRPRRNRSGNPRPSRSKAKTAPALPN